MNEVSGRFAKWVYESGLRDGTPEAQLLEGVNVPPEVLRRGKRRIAWDAYVQMLENYHAAVGIEKMRGTALEFGTTQELEFFSKIAGLFLSPKNLYRFMYRWAGNHFLRNVNFNFTTDPDGQFRITSRVDTDSRDSPVFFLTLANVLAGAPCRIGRPPAEVTIAEMQPHHAEYRISPPRSASIGWYLMWPLRALASIPAFASLFARQQEEIKLSHTAITRQQEDFSVVVDQISDCLLILGDDGRTLFANGAVRRRFGLDKKSATGWDPASALHGDGRKAWSAFVSSDDAGEREFRFRAADHDADGLWLSFGPPQLTMFGESDARMLVGRDVTEARQVEARVRQVAYEERRRIAGDLHDGLGQLLTGINWQTNLLANKLDGDGSADSATAARAIAELATDSIRQARDLAHGLAGIDELRDNLRRALVDHARKIEREFGLAVDLELPPAEEALSAPGQAALEVLRIVQEATHNAFKHAEAKRLRISVDTTDDRWRVIVADDGRGLGDDAGTASTGLGVRSMQYRAASLGGAVELRPRDDGARGSELALTLPPQKLSENRPVETAAAAPTPAPQKHGGVLDLMVADDHDTVRGGIVALLANEPDIEICAETGERSSIVPLALERRPDVIVIDMLMDGDDNLDTIRELRAEIPALRIVVLSMFHEEHYGKEALAAGADAYVMKQASPAELLDAVRGV